MKKKLLVILLALFMFVALIPSESEAAVTYYQTSNNSVPIWSTYSSNTSTSTKKTTITTTGYVLKIKDQVTNSAGNVWYQIDSGTYGGVSLKNLWVYSGNVTKHTHNYASNGGVCKSSGCGYEYKYTTSSLSGYYEGTVSGGAKIWSLPYSTGKSVQKGTIANKAVVTVKGKTTNAEGNVWYQLSSGYWVYSGNVKKHTHDCTGNGGVCKSSGCGYTYSYTVSSLSGYYEGTVSGGAKIWSLPYSTGSSVQKGTIANKAVVTVKGKTTNADGNVWYQLSSGYWVYSENVKKHTHDCTENGGVCKSSGCGYSYPISTSSFSATVVVTNSNGAKIWSLPYSTGKSSNVRTAAYNSVLSVTHKATNADGHVWYKLSDGNWVYPENVTRRYTVSYNANGGKGAPAAQYKLEGKSVTLSATKPTRVGYLFQSWNTSSSGSGTKYNPKDTYSKNADATLYAIWKECTDHSYTGGICDKCKKEYVIPTADITEISSANSTYMVINSDGAPVWSRPYSKNSTKIRTESYGNVVTVTQKVKNQAGNYWYKLSDGNYIYSSNIKRAYKVNYVLNGGTNNSKNPSYFYVGMSVTLYKPTRSGYTFNGWYLNSSYTEAFKTFASTGAVTLYAKWTPNTYTIDFSGNGATSGSLNPVNATYDVSVTLPSNAFKKTNYTFAGWNTKADGSGASYQNGATVSNLTATNGATVTLYAQWKATRPSITTNPSSVTVYDGDMATFTVKASGGGLKYQWQVSKDGGDSWNDCTSDGNKTATFSFKAQAKYSGWLYRCVISNSAGTVTSSTAKLTVRTKTPSVTKQPSSQTVPAGEKATFSVTAAGGNLSYQWQISKDGGYTWRDCTSSGNTKPTFGFKTKASYSGWMYRCVITNDSGSVRTQSVTLTVY